MQISIHAAREGGDVIAVYRHMPHSIFQSTPPVKAATQHSAQCYLSTEFQSTPPVKAATTATFKRFAITQFQSTPPVKAATIVVAFALNGVAISIHAAREGGDTQYKLVSYLVFYFNPRRP